MKAAYNREKIPMSQSQSSMFISIYMAESDKIEQIYNDLAKTFPIGGFIGRMDIFPTKFDKRLLVLLGCLYSDYGIGGMILIGYYLQWLASETEQHFLTVDWISSDVWPWGIFSKETISNFWDKQKVKANPDNLVDYASAAASFLTPIATE